MKMIYRSEFKALLSLASFFGFVAIASAAIYPNYKSAPDPYYPNGPIPQTPGCITFGDIGDESPMCDSCATKEAVEEYNQLMHAHLPIPTYPEPKHDSN